MLCASHPSWPDHRQCRYEQSGRRFPLPKAHAPQFQTDALPRIARATGQANRVKPSVARLPANRWGCRLMRRSIMHMLHLLRHAKSSWKEKVEDRERRLNRRGRESARRVGRHLPAAVGALDLVLCSSAVRTRETMDLILAEFSARPRSLLEDDVNVLLIGHNPELHELATTLADSSSPRFSTLASGKFPTAARASFQVSDPWSALGRSRYEIVDYVTADSLRNDKG